MKYQLLKEEDENKDELLGATLALKENTKNINANLKEQNKQVNKTIG